VVPPNSAVVMYQFTEDRVEPDVQIAKLAPVRFVLDASTKEFVTEKPKLIVQASVLKLSVEVTPPKSLLYTTPADAGKAARPASTSTPIKKRDCPELR